MRRFQIPCAALVAGLAVLLSGCSGETPTAPSSSGGAGNGTGGSCTALVSMSATTDSLFVGDVSIVRATVTKAGAPVPDGGSVRFTTDLGGSYFTETGLQTVSKTTSGGVADVTVASANAGTAHVVAVFDCAKAQKDLQFVGAPDTGPFISSFSPMTGSCAGGDLITILGVRFGTGANVNVVVYFGGVPGSLVSATSTQITVRSPARALKNPAVPEVVPLVVSVNGALSQPVSFTYACIPVDQRIFISSISPTSGTPAGGDTVQIFGGHFGTTIATTQVTFCGAQAQITAQQDQTITVTTPVHPLKDPAKSETCDVVVTRDVGLVSQQSATLAQAFTYRGTGSGGICNTDPTFIISNVTPNTGPPTGGTTVTLTGSGFGSSASLLRVDFGGTPATILQIVNGGTSLQVSTPIHTLANPNNPETVDITVTDLGSPVQRCARVVSGFVYTAAALQPTIFSVSPRTGPNDASTRVSIFGEGFQFPMQVFLTGGSCGQQRVEAAVSDISLNTIVFKTPVAVGANVCLSSQLVDIVILNPSTGKTASCLACFKYYACPTITSIAPGFGPYTGGTQVIITGHNFEEPAIVNGGGTAWQPISVSSQEIIAVTPPVLVSGCADISSAVLVNGTSLNCPNAIGPIFTYYVKSISPFISSISPSSVLEGGAAGVVITGGNFFGNVRVVFGDPLAPHATVFPTTQTLTQLTVTAPAFTGAFLKGPCTTTGGAAGTKNLPTPVDVDVLNVTTTCISSVEKITYIPTDTTCTTGPLTITTATLPSGTVGTPYSQTVTASGGTGSYTFTISGAVPTGLTFSSSGAISGTPTLAVTQTFTVTVDDGSTTASKILSITIN